MMRITQEADYAMRITCVLAGIEVSFKANERAENKIGATEISDIAKIPPRFTLSILRKMVMSGIVLSYKGKNGGYSLAKPSSEITLRDVIEAIDGPIAISKCIDQNHECSKQGFNKGGCRIHNIFVELNTQMSEKLAKISIRDAIDSSLPLEEVYALIR